MKSILITTNPVLYFSLPLDPDSLSLLYFSDVALFQPVFSRAMFPFFEAYFHLESSAQEFKALAMNQRNPADTARDVYYKIHSSPTSCNEATLCFSSLKSASSMRALTEKPLSVFQHS
jgi:hypothetical protein